MVKTPGVLRGLKSAYQTPGVLKGVSEARSKCEPRYWASQVMAKTPGVFIALRKKY
jgi:hypothetical protein